MLRARLRNKTLELGFQCQGCGSRRFCRQDRIRTCPRCGSYVATIIKGRFTLPVNHREEGAERVRQLQASYRQPITTGKRKATHNMAFKIVKRKAAATEEEEAPKKRKRGRVVEEEEEDEPEEDEEDGDEEEEEDEDEDEDDSPKKKKGKKKGAGVGALSGVTSGLGVSAFQNKTLEENRKKKLTDVQLAALWRKEFPKSKAVLAGRIDESLVRGVRGLFNRGKHSNNDGEPLDNPVPEYDEAGDALPFWGQRAAEAKAEKELKESAAARKAQKTPLKKKKKVNKAK